MAAVLTALDGVAILHPDQMVLLEYPGVGATIRLGILVREHRLENNTVPPTVPMEQAITADG